MYIGYDYAGTRTKQPHPSKLRKSMNKTHPQIHELSLGMAIWERFIAFLIASFLLAATYGATADLDRRTNIALTIEGRQAYWQDQYLAYAIILAVASLFALFPCHEMLYSVERSRQNRLKARIEEERSRRHRESDWHQDQNNQAGNRFREYSEALERGWPTCQPPTDYIAGWSERHNRGFVKKYPYP